MGSCRFVLKKAFILAAATLVMACSGKKTKALQEDAPKPRGASAEWSKRLPGLIGDLNVSQDGKAIVVSTVPDPDSDQGGGRPQYLTMRLRMDGVPVWTITHPHRIKHQAISKDANLVVVVDYNEELRAHGSNGEVLWSVTASCKPIVLEALGRILCIHDDDVKPGVAFETYSLEGKLLSEFSSKEDLLAFKVSIDGKYAGLGLSSGEVGIVDLKTGRLLWKRRVKGEIIDLAVADVGKELTFFGLIGTYGGGQRILRFGKTGKPGFDLTTGDLLDQIESRDGFFFGYGNNFKGQSFIISKVNDKGLEEIKRVSIPKSADFSSFVSINGGYALVGFERGFERGGTGAKSRIEGFSYGGEPKFEIPIASEEGGYLYAYGVTERAVVIATDDGAVSMYRLP